MTIPTSAAPIAGVLVQRTVDYEVTGALDASTPAVGTSVIDEVNTNVVTVNGDAGRFDPSRIDAALVAMGNRYIEWIEIVPAIPIVAGAFYAVVRPLQDEQGNDLIPAFGAEAILDVPFSQPQAGASSFFTEDPFFVPQAAEIRIGGFAASATRRNQVFMGIRMPTTAWEEALMMNAWCCAGAPPSPGSGSSGGGGTEVSRETQTFSSLGLVMDPAGPSYYFHFSAAVDPTLPSLNASESILVDNEGFVQISGEKFAQRAGSITALEFRSSVPLVCNFFVELAVGVGAFVRTFVANAVAIPANTNVAVPITVTPYDVDTRIRFGYTVDSPPIAGDVQAQLEFTTTG